jgi:ankyrin repeat protein
MRHAPILSILVLAVAGCSGNDFAAGDGNDAMAVFEAAVDPAQLDRLEAALASGAEVNLRDDNGFTPLHYAVLADNGPAVRLLLAAGADPAATDPQGRTAQQAAEQEQKLSAIQAFDRFEAQR